MNESANPHQSEKKTLKRILIDAAVRIGTVKRRRGRVRRRCAQAYA
jgi:hypothetical protein